VGEKDKSGLFKTQLMQIYVLKESGDTKQKTSAIPVQYRCVYSKTSLGQGTQPTERNVASVFVVRMADA
jgi:hypothetical protein